MITREQVKDLRVGDLAEAVHNLWPEDSVIRGRIYQRGGRLYLCGFYLRDEEGRSVAWEMWTRFDVIERAPRPLYVNHDRTEPVPGDVVRDADSDNARVWAYWRLGARSLGSGWQLLNTGGTCDRSTMPNRLRLLVDGTTGQVVP